MAPEKAQHICLTALPGPSSDDPLGECVRSLGRRGGCGGRPGGPRRPLPRRRSTARALKAGAQIVSSEEPHFC